MEPRLKSSDVEKFLVENSHSARWNPSRCGNPYFKGRAHGEKRFYDKEGKSTGYMWLPRHHITIWPWMVRYRILDIELCMRFLHEQNVPSKYIKETFRRFSSRAQYRMAEIDETYLAYI